MTQAHHPAQDPAEILAEDARAGSVEVWLLDDGRFLIPGEVHEAWRSNVRWRLLMRQRRALRMFVPAADVDRLPGIERSLRAGKRVYEIGDAFRKYEEWAAKPASDAPGNEVELGPDGKPETHQAKGQRILLNAARGALAHVRIVMGWWPERSSSIRTVPYHAPPVVWDEERKPAQTAKAPKAGKPSP